MKTTEINNAICNSSALKSGGLGIKFTVTDGGFRIPAFAIRFDDIVYAYLNRCAHLMLELDWDDTRYFDSRGDYLICANHGALFEPETGLCVCGPCHGTSLATVDVSEQNSTVLLIDNRFRLT